MSGIFLRVSWYYTYIRTTLLMLCTCYESLSYIYIYIIFILYTNLIITNACSLTVGYVSIIRIHSEINQHRCLGNIHPVLIQHPLYIYPYDTIETPELRDYRRCVNQSKTLTSRIYL